MPNMVRISVTLGTMQQCGTHTSLGAPVLPVVYMRYANLSFDSLLAAR